MKDSLLASVGAACHSDKCEASAVLLACGVSPFLAARALRLTVGRETSEEEIDRVLEAFRKL